MSAMISGFMAGVGLLRDFFKGLSTKCSTVGPFKLFFGLFFFAWLVYWHCASPEITTTTRPVNRRPVHHAAPQPELNFCNACQPDYWLLSLTQEADIAVKRNRHHNIYCFRMHF
ncbi:unnamed protein product [Rhodiola kirilowii]